MDHRCLRTWILLLLLPPCLGFTPLLKITPEVSNGGSDIPFSQLFEETKENEKKTDFDELIFFIDTDSFQLSHSLAFFTIISFENDPSWINSHLLLHNRAPPVIS